MVRIVSRISCLMLLLLTTESLHTQPTPPPITQPPFEVPLKVTDGQISDTLYFGIVPGAHFCFHLDDCFNGRCECAAFPPPPPQGVFDARFMSPRVGFDSACCNMGGWYDYRPFSSAAQRDTFRVRAQLGSGTSIVLSWPPGLCSLFQSLEMRHFGGTQLVITNMCTDTSTDITNANGDPHVATIYSGGVVVSVEQASSSVPQEFALSQNYPNPFNPTTMIIYQLATSNWVTLRVYDILGQEVQTLVNEKKEAGVHEVRFDAKGVPSGVYCYRLEAGALTQTRKLLLLR